MNIFFLDACPTLAATMQCDAHVNKMRVECGQMLAAVHYNHTYSLLSDAPGYPKSVLSHPCTLWASVNQTNRRWLYDHMCALINEHTYRFGTKTTACHRYIDLFATAPASMPAAPLTIPPLAMPMEYWSSSAVGSYRQYYRHNKAKTLPSFTYTRRNKPEWLNNVE